MAEETAKLSIKEKIDYILNQSKIIEKGNQESKEQLARFSRLAAGYNQRIDSFLKELALQSDTDLYDPASEKVALMTMHASKGLEFPVVFIVGCEDGLIPFKRPGTERVDEDEERWLFYVAMTRAKEELYLSYAKTRIVYGKTTQRSVSPFLMDIKEQLKQLHVQKKRPKAKDTHKQLNLFE